jgi:hypothetical protein
MGAWWANDARFWYALFGVVAAVIVAGVAIYAIARLGRDKTRT